MKKYIITEEHIEELRELFCVSKLQSKELDEWVGTLEYVSDVKLPYTGLVEEQPFIFDIPEDFYTNRAKYFVMLELEKPK